MYAFTAPLTSSNLAWASSLAVLAFLTASVSLVTASCNWSTTTFSAALSLAVLRANWAFSKVSFCLVSALFFSSTTLAFSIASALSLSATLDNFSIFSAKSSAISVSLSTIGLDCSFLSKASTIFLSSVLNSLVS